MATVLERVTARLQADSRFRAAYVFGSRARGEERPGSDLDIAVLGDGSIALEEQLRIHADLSAISPEASIDLALLETAAPLLRYEVVSSGHRLFSRDDEAMDETERRWIMEYFDTEHLRKVQRELQREAANDTA